MVSEYDTVDYFVDPALTPDPYPYFAHLRSRCPVSKLPQHDVYAVTGYEEAREVYRDTERFSSCNAMLGPFPRIPFVPEGDDVSEQIAQHRHQMPMGEYILAQDPPEHAAQRGLLMRLLTPKRMRENEAFIWDLADRTIGELAGRGSFEVLKDYAHPFSLLVIADLLGVPEADHREFRDQLEGLLDSRSRDPLGFMLEKFTQYVVDRRRRPRGDVLTQLASATYPDGSVPEVDAVVRTAAFLFAAGQDTTTRLISWCLRYLAEHREVQAALRADDELVTNFVEEMLRIESPVKSDFRMAVRTTTVGGVTIPAGASVLIAPGAANRDPSQFEDPDVVKPDRPNAQAHLSFGRGAHSCPGGPLSRIEARVSIQRLLARLDDIRISESHHGPEGDRRFECEPTYILRGLKELHLDFELTGRPA